MALEENLIAMRDKLEDKISTLTAQIKERDREIEKLRVPYICSGCEVRDRLISKLRDDFSKTWAYKNCEIDKLHAKNAALSKRVEELVEGLRKLEWIDSAQNGAERECPGCWNFEDTDITRIHWDETYIGHKPDCWLSKLIGGKE